MPFEPRALTHALAVNPQLFEEDLEKVKAAGFASIICNRPDFEDGPSQPTHESLAKACEALGLAFAYLPVGPAHQTEDEAIEMGHLLSSLPTPILAYCRSGYRCISLVSLAAQLGHPTPE
ncbi:MAG: TIGR01244 family phosphatase [Betaproteobacteria bacterium]|nr:TIGR01244 family phosphatase [Betaproteobacteria bacterium]NBT74445.1 TIGR01244 family phosphatase [Betaproteobacteria bacterium]NBY13809.1 TIGR01244 family phosphatase [Betaproteobacteria bacterium]